MSSQDYEPTRIAKLIEEFRQSSKLSVRKAASLADISEGRWRQIAKGYQQATKDVRVPVNAPPETLARMAIAVGITSGHIWADYRGEDAIDQLSREVADIIAKSEKTYPQALPVFGGSYQDANYMANVEGWLSEMQYRIEKLERTVAQLSSTRNTEELDGSENEEEETVVALPDTQKDDQLEDTEPEQKIAAYDRELGDNIQPGDLPDHT